MKDEGDRYMTRQITLTRDAQQIVNPGDSQSYRYVVTASDGVDMPNEIFRMVTRPLDPTIGTLTTTFDGICTPADLQFLPVNEPVDPDIHFRVSSIDMTFASPTDGEDQWVSIKSEVTDLVSSMNANDNLSVQEIVTID